MSIPLSVSGVGGAFDLLMSVNNDVMGFITSRPMRVKQVSTFAPSIRIGGDPAYSNDSYQQMVINGFDSGGDQELFRSDDRRYQWSDGNLALHVEDRITLASKWEESDAGVTALGREILDFNPSTAPQPWVVAATGTQLRAFNTTTELWGDVFPGAGDREDFYLFANDQYLFYSFYYNTTSARVAGRWDGSALGSGTAALGGVGATCKCLGWYKQTLYCTSGSNLYAATNNNGSAWSSAIPVGFSGTNITDIYESNGLLFIAKPEGLYSYDGTTVYKLLDARTTYTTNCFRGMTDWLGALYIPWLNGLHKGAISTAAKISAQDITPRMKGDTAKERYGHGQAIKCFAGPNKLFIALDGGEGTYPELLAYNGIGFHQLYRGTASTTMGAAGYSRTMDWIFINDGNATRRKKVINCGDAEYPNFATYGTMLTPALDAGFPGEQKAYKSLQLEVADLESDAHVNIQYRLDGGSWVTPSQYLVDSDGVHELILSSSDGHVVGKKIEFKIVVYRGSTATITPVIKMPMIVRLMVIPEAIDAYQCQILVNLTEKLRNGNGPLSNTEKTIEDIIAFINRARDSTYPVIVVDEIGRRFVTKITEKSENWGRRTTGETYAEVPIGLLDLSPSINRRLSFISTEADSGSITPAMTLATGAPTPEWIFTDPDGTVTTYNTASCSHIVSGTGTTEFTLGPTTLYRYIETLNISGDNVEGIFDTLKMGLMPNLTSLDMSGNALLDMSIAVENLQSSLTYLNLSANTISAITGDLDLPSAMTNFTVTSTASVIEGSLSQLPSTMQYLQLKSTASVITGGSTAIPATGIQYMRLDDMSLAEANVDSILERLYNDRMSFTYATPYLYIGGTNDAPSGVYQDATPPTTGEEFRYKLENDPDTEGFNVWTTDL